MVRLLPKRGWKRPEDTYVEKEYAGVEYDFDLTEQQVTPLKALQVEVQSQEMFEAELSVLSAAKILAETSKERVKTYSRRRRRSTDSSQVSTAAGLFSTAEDIQDTDEELAKKFDQERKAADDIDWSKIVKQAQERQSGSMIRYQSFKKKPVIVAQARKNMMVYLKNMANYKMKYFKGMSYDQIRPIFEEEYRKVQTFFKKDSKVSKSAKKRVAEEALLQESFKKVRTAQALGLEPFHQEKSTEEPKELSEEDLKKMLEIVPVEEFRVEALQTKYPIIDWEIHTEGSRKELEVYQDEHHRGISRILKYLNAFDREDLDTLWSLVKEKFNLLKTWKKLLVELKRLYEPNKEDALWKLQRYMHDPLTLRLYGSMTHAVLAKEYSQPKSTYEAASLLTEFELKKILIDKMDESQSYLTALE
ncbi:hypothetical protein Tco_0672538 [Tanacetum coccineum]